jgi:glycosyltransferase involved in cell wall biosynthesis
VNSQRTDQRIAPATDAVRQRRPAARPSRTGTPTLAVGFLCAEYPSLQPGHGGIGSVVQTLARALVACGHSATVYALQDHEGVTWDEGVRVVAVPRRGALSAIVTMRRRLRRDFQAGLIQVVDAPECEAHCVPAGVPSIVRMQGSHHFWCATLDQARRYPRLLLEQWGIRQARALCAVSTYAAEVTRRAMHLGRRPIEILSNPVDTALFVPRPESVVRNRLVFAGAITEKKGVRELCLAMPTVVARFPDAELILIGRDIPVPGGPLLREAILRALDEPARRRVRFLGPRPRPEVSAYMASAHACVFPSHMETQGIVIAEGLACGRPVITTSAGPGPEMLGADGECGWLVNPKDPGDIAAKILRVLGEPDRGERLGRNGRRRADEQFSLASSMGRNLEFWARVVAPRHAA